MNKEKAIEYQADFATRYPRWNFSVRQGASLNPDNFALELTYFDAEGKRIKLYSENPIIIFAYVAVFY